jgi:transposase
MELVNEGGISIYMAAKEVDINYSTAKSIMSKKRAGSTFRKESAKLPRKKCQSRLLEVVEQEVEFPQPQRVLQPEPI